ncbi:MAG: orotidine 5'-phosphate decarboxylase [Candidatus Aminicenantes bacterium RBG_16_63_16]|nr:MAG: orotidine 5'-phosphate decarboxylase [Candidatus Aminicenantes bacterium RBG_16_63_16]
MAGTTTVEEKIIIALDVGTKAEALALAIGLPEARIFKIGMELFTAEGPALLEEIAGLGKKAFLDLKYHDIPNTAAGAVRSAVRHGVHMLTLHASGGREMIRRAVEAAGSEAAAAGRPKPILLGVTVLTSLKDEQLREIGCAVPVAEQVVRLAALAAESGIDGIVCSPLEIEAIKRELGRAFLVVTPGIRPAWAAAQDQKRVMTPAEAVLKGADYMVIGRPVTAAPSPRDAFSLIVRELAQNPAVP